MDLVKCPRCYRRIPKDAVICPLCGHKRADLPTDATPTDLVCPQCYRRIPKEAVICPVCGHQLADLPSAGRDHGHASPKPASRTTKNPRRAKAPAKSTPLPDLGIEIEKADRVKLADHATSTNDHARWWHDPVWMGLCVILSLILVPFGIYLCIPSKERNEMVVASSEADTSGSSSAIGKSNGIPPEVAYERDVSRIKSMVLAATDVPSSARFCDRFRVIPNENGNRVYVGWYRNKGLNEVEYQDNIVSEINPNGDILTLDVGAF